MDNIINCNRCGGNCCYETIVSPKVKNYFCIGCGFQSNSLMKKDSKFFNEQMGILPDLYKALMVEDETGLIWMPSSVTVPDKGMVFANGNNHLNWRWSAVRSVPTHEKEKEKFKMKDGSTAEYHMDMSTMKYFEEKEFMDALSYIKLLPE